MSFNEWMRMSKIDIDTFVWEVNIVNIAWNALNCDEFMRRPYLNSQTGFVIQHVFIDHRLNQTNWIGIQPYILWFWYVQSILSILIVTRLLNRNSASYCAIVWEYDYCHYYLSGAAVGEKEEKFSLSTVNRSKRFDCCNKTND